MGSLSHATGWHARNLAQIKSRTRAVSKAAKAVENAPAGKKRKQAVVARMTAEKRLKAAKATARESAALVEGLEHDPFSGLGSKRVLYSVIAMPPSDLLAGKVQVALAELESPCMATLLPPSATYPLSVIRRGPEPPARSSS